MIMRYNQIRSIDISNGEGVGVALFTQGCPFKCDGCFNPETWSFDTGKEFTQDNIDKIVELCSKSYIHRLSILGGEPLVSNNYFSLACLINKIKKELPHIKIWLYTGYTFENLLERAENNNYLNFILKNIDIMVDGPFIQEEKDITLTFRGSRNQRIIDMPQSLIRGKIMLYNIDEGSNSF